MPSDDRLALASAAIAKPLAVYRSAVISSLERVHGVLASAGGPSRLELELGAFAHGRIDAERFSSLIRGSALDAGARARITHAASILEELSVLRDDAFVIDLRSGGPLDLVVSSTLATLGRAFGAAVAADLVRTERYRPSDHDLLTLAWGFDHWTRDERRHAPPLVVTVDAEDLRPETLAHLIDGSIHIVLVVRGTCAPAPLVRLITPGTLVLQTHDSTGLDRFGAYAGPAIAALVSDNAATFIHDPERGSAPWQRITIWKRPATDLRKSIGAISPRQQNEELAQLTAIAEQPSLSSTPVDALAPAGAGDPTERLASWLLAQSGLEDAI
ncbi:MAG TPA: hypothetical protein VKP00_11025 [Gemmatimonadaceae bacterium]|nr:hypothetical protein [Gemmatimonadaceae bacterium]